MRIFKWALVSLTHIDELQSQLSALQKHNGKLVKDNANYRERFRKIKSALGVEIESEKVVKSLWRDCKWD